MRNTYLKIFIGLLIVFLDLNIGRVNILPDFIGYFVIYLGLMDGENYNRNFGEGKMFAFILAALGIVSIIANLIFGGGLITRVISIINLICSIALDFYICKGTIQIAESAGDMHFASQMESLWKGILYTTIATIVLSILGALLSLFNIFLGVVGLASFAIHVIYVVFIFKAMSDF